MGIAFWFNSYSIIKLFFCYYTCGEDLGVEKRFCFSLYFPNNFDDKGREEPGSSSVEQITEGFIVTILSGDL
jgi:hypothetical protein